MYITPGPALASFNQGRFGQSLLLIGSNRKQPASPKARNADNAKYVRGMRLTVPGSSPIYACPDTSLRRRSQPRILICTGIVNLRNPGMRGEMNLHAPMISTCSAYRACRIIATRFFAPDSLLLELDDSGEKDFGS
jgi:hypothetical protein